MGESEQSARSLNEALARARASARFTQDEVGLALGVNRAMVSYWESGTRIPNDRQISALARLYSIEPADLLEGRLAGPASADLAGLLLREGHGIGSDGVTGIREFVHLLDRFAELCRVTGEPSGRPTQSPFAHRAAYTNRDDARRKAQEVRAHLGLGAGPLGSVDSACEALGVTVYQAPLGPDLDSAPPGAFLRHPEAGLSILVNYDMSPGRRRFAIAHGCAHALFHSHETSHVLCGDSSQRERFADLFAGEFLMPSDGVRRFAEQLGLPPRISDPADIVHIQHYFDVSWPTVLVRLRQMNVITQDTYARFRTTVQPESLARALGYPARREPKIGGPAMSFLLRFPRSFLRMLRRAVVTDVMSPASAAAFTGLALPDIAQLISQPTGSPEEVSLLHAAEFREYEVTGVV
ncbi:MAG: ImmA/IrrE family metallo-endopeptidase [Acidimicrobiales bacterium]|nr:ImmA/IrrE family metallo-endopeptidase [Acidimicrobiales bacterium]MYH73418.1 ImmA/IrrE family metallo-endopeptidase [Acidimicrobiales bacterium]MYK72767.1 ImmA/IrrE family metallo-endopeptidase [Acidimicrobiales bacterium]